MFKSRIFFQAALLSLGLLFIGARSDHAPPCSTSPFLASTKLVEYDSNSVTISWSSSSSVAGYQVEYGPHGFAHGQGTLLQTTQSSTTISGLDPDTAYNFYLRDSCGPGQVGVWSRTYFYVDLPSDSIQPSLAAQPFVQDTLPMGWGNNGSLSRWDWRFIYPNHRAPFLEPEGFAEGVPDHTDSLTSGYAFCKPKFTNGKAWLSTPYFRIDSFQHPYLRFWLFRRDTLNNPAYNFKVFAEVAGQRIRLLDYTQNHPQWKKFGLSLDTLASDTLRIIFEYPQANIPFGSKRRMADLLLDDVEVVEKPACALSNMEAISQIGPYSATILSEPTGSLKQEIRFTTAGLGQYIINSTVNDTFQLTGLPPATRFKFYLRDSCANGQLSGWSGPWYFTTGCATLTAPWHEPFYNKELTCYQNYGTTFLNKWYVDYQVLSPYYSADFVKDHSNVGPATYFASPRVFNSLEDAFLELPEIDISSLTNPRLSFFLFSLNDDWYPDTFKNTLFRAQIRDNNGQWQNLYRFRGNDTNWQYHFTSLAGFGDTINLRFQADGQPSNANRLLLDDIRVAEAPSCQRPDSVYVDTLSATSATLGWTGGSGTYVVEYQRAEFRHGTGSTQVTNGNSLTLANLRPNTRYKFYVRRICGNDTSQYTLGRAFKTTCRARDTLPTFRDFEKERLNSTSLKSCWQIDSFNKVSWQVGIASAYQRELPLTGPLFDPDSVRGRHYLFLNSHYLGDSSSLISPTFDASRYQEATLSFKYHMYGLTMGDLKVKLDTGRVFTIFQLQGQQQPHDYSPWKKAVIPLDSFQLKGEFSVIFTGLQTNGMYSEMALDDILITDSCLFDTATAGFQASLDTAVRTAFTYRFSALDSGASRYIWDFGDGQTDTSTLPSISHSYTQDSLYTVSLKVEDDCNTARRSQSDTLTVRGIGSKEYPLPRAKLEIYPNPAREKVTIKAPFPQAATLRIYSVQGKLVRTLKMTGGKAVVPIQHLARGLYLVRVQEHQGKFTVH